MRRDEAPDQAEYGKLVAFLTSRGINVSGTIGNTPNGRTRTEIADELKLLMRTK